MITVIRPAGFFFSFVFCSCVKLYCEAKHTHMAEQNNGFGSMISNVVSFVSEQGA